MICTFRLGILCLSAAEKKFDLSAGPAEQTIKVFSRQAGVEVFFPSSVTQGVRTNVVQGVMPVREALERMIAGSGLVVVEDEKSGAISLKRKRVAGAQLPAEEQQTEGDMATRTNGTGVLLSPFIVSAKGLDRYRANEAISAIRVRAPLMDTGSSVSVLTRDFIDDLSPMRLFDATRFVAGVQEGRYYNFSDRMILRGFESNGRTVDNFLSDSVQNYDESLVERIEISKGPNAILSPAGTPGGTVNVVTKSPRYTPRRSVTAVGGSFDAQRLVMDLTGPAEWATKFAYRLIAVAQDSRRDWASEARLRRKIISPQITYCPGSQTLLTVKFTYSDSWAGNSPLYVVDSAISSPDATPQLQQPLNKNGFNGMPAWNGLHYVDTTGNVLLTSTLKEHVNLRFAAHARRTREDSRQASLVVPSLLSRYDPSTGLMTPDYTWALDETSGRYVPTYSRFFNFNAVTLDRTRADVNNTYLAAQFDLATSYRIGGVTAQTVGGGAIARQRQYDRRWRAPLAAFNLAAGQEVPLPDFPMAYQDNRTQNWNGQLYLNERLGFLQDRLFLNGGVLRYTVHAKTDDALTAGATHTLDSSKFLGLASVVLKLSKRFSTYASYSTNGTPLIANNRAFWSEGRQHEYGVKSEFFDQKLSFTVAHFEISQTNASVPNPNRLFDFGAPPDVVSNLKDHGFEFEVAGALSPNTSIVAAYTTLKLRDPLGRRVRAVADETGSVLLNHRFNSGVLKGLSATVGVVCSGSKAGDMPAVGYTPLGVPTQRSFLVKPYALWNANASYRCGRMTYSVFGDNLFDERGITQGGGRAGLGLAPAFRRNVRLAAGLEF